MASLWNLFGLLRSPSPIKEVPDTVSECDTCSDTASAPLPYIPTDHNHVSLEGRPNRKVPDLVWLNETGFLAAEEPCYVEHPGTGKRHNYVLSFMYDVYGADELRSSGWCSIRLTNHENMPLCHFRDQHMD